MNSRRIFDPNPLCSAYRNDIINQDKVLRKESRVFDPEYYVEGQKIKTSI